MTGWVPLAEAPLGTSRQRPDAALTRAVPLGGGVVVPPLTRYTTVPWPGTLAVMAPVLLVVAPVQASRRMKELPDFPAAAAVVEMVVVPLPWLNRATATSPLASLLASTRRVPS